MALILVFYEKRNDNEIRKGFGLELAEVNLMKKRRYVVNSN